MWIPSHLQHFGCLIFVCSLIVPNAMAQAPKPAASPSREAKIAKFKTEYVQAQKSNDGEALFRALVPLADLTEGTPEWGLWRRRLMWREFHYGSQKRAIELGEELIAKRDVPPMIYIRAAAELAWFYFEVNQIAEGTRTLDKAEAMHAVLPITIPTDQRELLEAIMFVTRGHKLWKLGNLEASTNALRQGLAITRRSGESSSKATRDDTGIIESLSSAEISQRLSGQLLYALLREGRAAEALSIAQEWLVRLNTSKLARGTYAVWQRRQGSALLAQRRYEEALAAVRIGFGDQQEMGAEDASHFATIGYNTELRSLIGLRRWAEADTVYKQYRDGARSDPVAFQRASNAPLESVIAAKNGRIEEALKRIEGSIRARARLYGNNHYLTRESRGIRGAVQLIGGSVDSALKDYEELFTALLDTPSGWTDLSPTGMRGYYLEVALDEFLKYAADRFRAGGAAGIPANVLTRLVQLLDHVGTGPTQQSIIHASARVRAGNPELKSLLDREQTARRASQGVFREIADLLAKDNSKTPGVEREKLFIKIKELRSSSENAQRELDEIRKIISSRFPAYRDLVTPVSPKPEAVQAALVNGEAFIGILPTQHGTFIWAINHSGQRALHVSAWSARDIAQRTQSIRKHLDIGALLPAALASFEFAPFHELYSELIKPIAPALSGVNTLVIGSAGALAGIPFGVLLTAPGQDIKSAQWLVRDFAITQLPGASAFVSQRRTASRNTASKPLIAYADPDFGVQPSAAPSATRMLTTGPAAKLAAEYVAHRGFRYASLPRLPETRDEVAAIATAVGAEAARDLILGERATRQHVLSHDLSNYRVVAFATHGLLPGEIPGVSRPSLAMAVARDVDESPLLDLDDVLTLKLNADWVVLSACNTAGAESDGQAMSGLVRGFFFAGGRSVLATHWAVETDSATALVGEVFRSQARNSGQTRAASVREGQLALIQGKIGAGKYAHPFYWSPYALFGDPAK